MAKDRYVVLVLDARGEVIFNVLASRVTMSQDVKRTLPSDGRIPYGDELSNWIGGLALGAIHLDIMPLNKEMRAR